MKGAKNMKSSKMFLTIAFKMKLYSKMSNITEMVYLEAYTMKFKTLMELNFVNG